MFWLQSLGSHFVKFKKFSFKYSLVTVQKTRIKKLNKNIESFFKNLVLEIRRCTSGLGRLCALASSTVQTSGEKQGRSSTGPSPLESTWWRQSLEFSISIFNFSMFQLFYFLIIKFLMFFFYYWTFNNNNKIDIFFLNHKISYF